MKYTPESFILQNARKDSPLGGLQGVLLYGFDDRLIQVLEHEVMALFRAHTTRVSVSEALKDPEVLNPCVDMFSKNTLNLVIIEGVTDAFLKTLENTPIHVKLLLKGDLKTKSKLVGFAESRQDWASVACYESHLGTAEALMSAHLGKVIPEFLPLAGDALEVKNQINIWKILSTSWAQNHGAVLTQSPSNLALTVLEYALFSPQKLSKSMFDEVIDEFSSVGFARILINHALKFLELIEKMETLKLSVEGAIQTMMPPLFFKSRPFYIKILQTLGFDQCKKLAFLFYSIEKNLKSSHSLADETFWGSLLTLQKYIEKPLLKSIYTAGV